MKIAKDWVCDHQLPELIADNEIFKDIPGYEKLYAVSTYGRVYSYRTHKVLRSQINRGGYEQLHFKISGKRRSFTVHKLVGITHIPNLLNLPQINHIDGNKLHNHIDNLEWIDHIENSRHAKTNRLYRSSDRNGNAKLTRAQVIEIKEAIAKGEKLLTISKRYPCSYSNIKAISQGRSWQYVK